MSIEQAALITGINESSIHRLVETRKLHHSKTTTGRLLICCASLEFMQQDQEEENEDH
jgi:hypothetical protein